MALHGRLIPWLAKHKLIIKEAHEKSETDEYGDSVNSHNCLNGGVWRVPMSMNSEFLEIYADDCEKSVVYSVSENGTPVYKTIFDLDFHGPEKESKEKIAEYTCEIVNTIKRFYPSNAESNLFKYIICKAKDTKVSGDWKQGRHIIFPFLSIVKEYGQTMVASIRAALEAKFGARVDGFNSWKDVVDAAIHVTPHLRMVYSDKPEHCKKCASIHKEAKTKSKTKTTESVCSDPLCVRQKVMTNRPYKPQMVMNGDGSSDTTMLRKLMCNVPLCVRMTSIRTSFSSPTPGFRYFPGATSLGEDESKIITDDHGQRKYIAGNGRKPTSGNTEFSFGNDAAGSRNFKQKKTFIDDNDARCDILVRAARMVSSHYTSLLYKNAFFATCKRTPSKYILYVKGEGSQYCLNARDNHKSASIYFAITPQGIRQSCFCKCDKVRVSGIPCNGYKSSLFPVAAESLKILFPDMANEFTFHGIRGMNTKRKVKELKRDKSDTKRIKSNGVTSEELDGFRINMPND